MPDDLIIFHRKDYSNDRKPRPAILLYTVRRLSLKKGVKRFKRYALILISKWVHVTGMSLV
jgi:hypothetical protein